jgi:predicted Zn-dependent protease
LSPDRAREKNILLERIAANLKNGDPMETELFSKLPMVAMEHHLWHAMGSALLAAGHPERALSAFQRHIRRQPWSGLGYSGAAQALEVLGRRDEALEMLERIPRD